MEGRAMRNSMRVRNLVVILLTTVLGVGLGCGTTPESSSDRTPDANANANASANASASASSNTETRTTRDGLVLVKSDADGDLYLRADHGIGGYDAIVIAPAFVHYRRASPRLEPDTEELYLVSLEQALVDEADSVGAPVVYSVGECVIKIGVGFLNVDLARSDSAQVLGEMLLVVEYQDSLSGESLLRMTAPKRIERESEGVSRDEQVKRSFEQMIDEVNMTSAIRAATATPSGPREGCKGALLRAGLPDAES